MSVCYPCLPSGVKDGSVVNVITETTAAGAITTKKITVKETLGKLKAKCHNGQLIDGEGRQIRFYNLQGCWGNPPADYLKILDTQRKEIDDLKQRFTVIEMTCNPDGVSPQSIF